MSFSTRFLSLVFCSRTESMTSNSMSLNKLSGEGPGSFREWSGYNRHSWLDAPMLQRSCENKKHSNECSKHIGRQKRESLLIIWKDMIVYVKLDENIILGKMFLGSLSKSRISVTLCTATLSCKPYYDITSLNVNLGSTSGARTRN